MIDIHSHIICGIDDGAANDEESQKMLRLAEKNGDEIIFATPHYMKGIYEPDFDTVKQEAEKLKQMAKAEGINIEIACGQEIMLENSIIDRLQEGKVKGLNGTRYMLVEFPMDKLPEDAGELLYELKIRGMVPIVAHPERYKYVIEKPYKMNKFIDEGCLFQLNAGSLTGKFGKEVKKTAELLVKSGLCSFIASDAHDSRHRTPEFKDVVQLIQKYDEKLLFRIYKNLSSLMNNEKIETEYERFPEKKRKRKSIFDIY